MPKKRNIYIFMIHLKIFSDNFSWVTKLICDLKYTLFEVKAVDPELLPSDVENRKSSFSTNFMHLKPFSMTSCSCQCQSWYTIWRLWSEFKKKSGLGLSTLSCNFQWHVCIKTIMKVLTCISCTTLACLQLFLPTYTNRTYKQNKTHNTIIANICSWFVTQSSKMAEVILLIMCYWCGSFYFNDLV